MRRAMHMRSVSGVCRMRHIIKALRALPLEFFTKPHRLSFRRRPESRKYILKLLDAGSGPA
jgi:hypothetical protein